jgi:hypothetical protein
MVFMIVLAVLTLVCLFKVIKWKALKDRKNRLATKQNYTINSDIEITAEANTDTV